MHNDTWYKGGKEYNDKFSEFLTLARDAKKNRSTVIPGFGAGGIRNLNDSNDIVEEP